MPSVADRRAGTVRSVVVSLGGNSALLAVNMVTGILAARLLGPAGRGSLVAMQVWPSMLTVVGMLGMPEAALYLAAQRERREGEVVITATVLSFLMSLVIAVGGWFLFGPLLAGQPDEVLVGARVSLFILPLFGLSGVPFQMLRGLGRFGLWNLLRLTVPLGWLATTVAFTVTGTRSPLALAVAYVLLAGATVPVALGATFTALRPPFRFAGAEARPLLRFGVPSMVAGYPQLFNLRVDQAIMASFLPARDLGLYVAAVAWSSLIHLVPTALGAVAFPSVALADTAAGRRAEAGAFLRTAVLCAAVVACALAPATPFGLRMVFGGDFSGATTPALVLLAAGVPLAFNTVAGEVLRGLGRPSAVLRAEGSGAVAGVVSLSVLLPAMGILGAAFASVIGYSTSFLVLSVALRRPLGSRSVAEVARPTAADVRRMRGLLPKIRPNVGAAKGGP